MDWDANRQARSREALRIAPTPRSSISVGLERRSTPETSVPATAVWTDRSAVSRLTNDGGRR